MKTRFFILAVMLLLLAGCTRNRPSDDPPIHLNPNMDAQERYEAQGSSQYFEDGSAMRTPVEGTVARGWLADDIELMTGRNHQGELVSKNPLTVDMALLKRGQKRFNIYCAPCHSKVGDGRGIMIKKGYLPPPSFDDPRLLEMPEGHFFETITNGVRNMPSYKSQVPVRDRWAIVAYLRALQCAKTAKLEDIPAAMRDQVK